MQRSPKSWDLLALGESCNGGEVDLCCENDLDEDGHAEAVFHELGVSSRTD